MTDEGEDLSGESPDSVETRQASPNDKTDEIRDAVGESGTLGGATDGDSGAILTLDGDADDAEGEDDSESDGDGQ